MLEVFTTGQLLLDLCTDRSHCLNIFVGIGSAFQHNTRTISKCLALVRLTCFSFFCECVQCVHGAPLMHTYKLLLRIHFKIWQRTNSDYLICRNMKRFLCLLCKVVNIRMGIAWRQQVDWMLCIALVLRFSKRALLPAPFVGAKHRLQLIRCVCLNKPCCT